MSYPSILYENALAVGTLTATSTASGYGVASLLTRDPWLRWKAGGTGTINLVVDHTLALAQAVDTLAITTHNLHECGGTLLVGQSDDNITYTESTILTAPQMIGSYGRTLFLDVSGVSGMGSAHRYHRIQFNATTSAVYVGCLALGRRLDLTEYMVKGFDPLAVDVKMNAPRSRVGSFLPACVESVKQTVTFVQNKSGMASTFYDNATFDKTGVATPNWQQFNRESWCQGYPFWFAFDHGAQAYRQGWLAWPKRDDDAVVTLTTPTVSGRRTWKFDFNVYAEMFSQ